MKSLLSKSLLAASLIGFLAGCSAEKPAETAKAYPLDVCAVSGEKLGEMGEPYVFTHEGQEIKLCCKSCLDDFKKDPAKYLTKISEAGTKAVN